MSSEIPENGIITDIEKIRNYIEKGFKPKQFEEQGWEYDLSLGCEYYTSTDDLPKYLSDSCPFAVIRPGDFALLITEESFNVPNDVMGFISIKFTYKQKGLINISGFHIDPGYKGNIIFSVYNAGPNDIVMRKGDPVFMVFFQGIGTWLEKKPKTSTYGTIPAPMISAIRGKNVSLAANAERIAKLEHYIKFYGAILVSATLTLAGVLIKHYFFP